MIALRADNRRAQARRQAVESAVSAGAYGRPVESRPPAPFPQVSHSRLGRRLATPTATWKTLRVYHSSHSLDDDELSLPLTMKGGPIPTPVTAQRGHSINQGSPSAPHTKVSAFVEISVHVRRNPHKEFGCMVNRDLCVMSLSEFLF
jgi:hypothetical protein